jgi:putative mycofactocin binding protein MftB
MSQPPPCYRLIDEVKIRRETFGGILYKYGCADRGALSFINSRQLIDLLLNAQQAYGGDLGAAVEQSNFSATSKQKLYTALDDLARRGYVLVGS